MTNNQDRNNVPLPCRTGCLIQRFFSVSPLFKIQETCLQETVAKAGPISKKLKIRKRDFIA